MKITIFTGNQTRHNFFINLLSNISDELFVIQECNTIFPAHLESHYKVSETMKIYFDRVKKAQNFFFGNTYIKSNKKINLLPIKLYDLNKLNLSKISDFLNSDIYLVFGSSFIKGELVNYLIEKKAINIHMGIAPFYRGADCNFWAIYDNNPHLVGSTVHLLSKGLDSGEILFHAISNIKNDPFEYSMSTVKSVFKSIISKIEDNSLLTLKSHSQKKNLQIRYSVKDDFTDTVVKEYMMKKINLMSKKFDDKLLINPFVLEN